jgi:hypothetical protein
MLALAILAGAAVLPAPAGAIEVRVQAFGDGQGGAVVAFPSAGSNDSLNLSIQSGMRIGQAFFNISGEPYTAGGTDCPESPSLDLGADGDVEWRFNGTGYGALGHQYLFSEGAASFQAVFTAAGVNDSMALRLPAGASVADASFDLRPSGFSGLSVNVSVDIGADDVDDWTNTTFSTQLTLSGLASLIGSYLASAQPTGGDPYGVLYVDVPVRLRCASAATLTATNLSIRYTTTLTTPNLALKLDALVPGALGTSNVSVPVRLSSGSAGVLRVRDLFIAARSPLHTPDLTDPSPPVSPDVDIKENQSVAFSVNVHDIYGDPVTLQWFVDVQPVAGADGPSFLLSTNHSWGGRHSVTVTAGNGLSESSLTWWVNVEDVNLPPVIRSFAPAAASVAEGSPLQFTVDAYDPDGGALAYTWTLDGRVQSERGAAFVYLPQTGAAGYHAVALSVGDAGGATTLLNWTVLVRKTNLPPVIESFEPAQDAVMKEGQTLALSVSASDPNGDTLTYEWVLNGYSAGFGRFFNFSPDFSSAGAWTLQALVRDGASTTAHPWNITVLDVNHEPTAVIEQPLEGAEFLDSARIVLSARGSSDADLDQLSYRWYEGADLLAEGLSANLTLEGGSHRIRLVVEDGKGGRGVSDVNITVRTSHLSAAVSLSSKSPREGEQIRVAIRVSNTGDTIQRDVPVRLIVDGVPAGTRTIRSIAPGGNATEYFYWTAEAGKHDLELMAGDESTTVYVTIPAGVPAMVIYMVYLLGAVLLAVAATAWLFFFQWKRAISAGIVDESKRRGRKELAGKERADDRRPRGFFNIRLGFSPYKEKPLKIDTTMPEDLAPQEAIRESLTPVRKSYLMHAIGPREPAGGARSSAAAPVTAGVFAAKRPEVPPAPAEATGVEIPLAHPAPAGKEPDAPVPPVRGAPPPPPPAPPASTEAGETRRPKKRLEDFEERLHALERKGLDVAAPRRFASLAKSFWKGGNVAKAEQYLDKAESKLAEVDQEAGPQKAGLACKKCGAAVDPSWIVCPECEAKLK